MNKIVCIYFILTHALIWAQQPFAIELNENKNLPSNTVFNIYNDSKGFVWLATPKGLYKYDGTKYQVYKSDKQSSISGSDIKEDIYGRIWYQNFDGFLFYVKNNRLNTFLQNTPIGYIPFGITDKYLFVVQKKGIDIFDLKTLSLLNTIELSIETAEHTTVLDNNFYLIADDIIYKIDSNFSIQKSNFFIGKNLHVKYIYPLNQQLYVVSKLNETKKVYFFNKELDFEGSFSTSNISYIQGSDYVNNIIWIHTTKGSYAYSINGELIFDNSILEENSISKLTKDYRGNLWFASVDKGIFVVQSLDNKLLDKHNASLKTITKYKDDFLLGSDSGELLLVNSKFKNKKNIHKIDENLPTSYIYYDSIANNVFFSNKGFYLVHDKDFEAAKKYDIALKDIVKLDNKYYAFAASNICGIFKDPKVSNHITSIWDSIFYSNKSEKYNDIIDLIQNVRGKSVIYIPEKKAIYFATNTGIFTFNDGELSEIKDNGKDFYATKLINFNNQVYALSSKGNLYIITNNNVFTNISDIINTPIEDIQFIKKFEKFLLLVCNDNMYMYDGKQLQTINFTNNLQNIYDAYYDKNTLIVLTNEGVISLKLSSINNKIKNLFHITNITVNDFITNVSDLRELTYDKNNIRIYFSLLDYIVNNSSVCYRINNSDWVFINKSTRYLDFPSLAAGSYHIEFKVDGEIQPEKIDFTISLPFWKTWWFYTLLMLLGVALAYGYFKWQSKLMMKQIKLLNEKIALEKDLRNSMLSTIKSQMNPHFFYNALNTIQAYIFKNDKLKANNYLAKFSKLTRIILEMSEKETILLTDELDSIKLYLDLEQMRFSDDFEYKITIANEVKAETIEFPPMLLQPYVENAIKHGLLHSNKYKLLNISLELNGQNLVIKIDDNGIGRVKSAEINNLKNRNHQSFATQAIDKRLEILNKERLNKITVQYVDKYSQGIATGTKVILIIPIM